MKQTHCTLMAALRDCAGWADFMPVDRSEADDMLRVWKGSEVCS